MRGGSRVEPAQESVRVELLSQGATSDTSLVAVTVPQQLRSFVAPLPAELYERVTPERRADTRAALENGAALPGWLRFDAATMTVIGTDVPEDGLPLRLALNIAGQRVVVVSKAAAR